MAADVHRALLVVSCLLLELLPPPPSTTSSSPDASNGDCVRARDGTSDGADDDDTRPGGRGRRDVDPVFPSPPISCPLMTTAWCRRHRDDDGDDDDDDARSTTMVRASSPASIVRELLIACRTCIRNLRTLERACAARAIRSTARGHRATSASNTTKTAASTSCGPSVAKILPPHREGGDDIHDYDRHMSDLSDNYEWHDDGFLPPPSSSFFHDDNDIDDGGGPRRSSTSSSWCVDANHHISRILRDCFLRRRHTTDPPSSKFERCAHTRDWIRDERLISLNLEDYASYPRYVRDIGDNVRLCEEGIRDGISSEDATNDEDGCRNDNGKNSDDSDDGKEEGGDGISLNIASDALAMEEQLLLDVMLADGVVASSSLPRLVHASDALSGHCTGYYHEFDGMNASLDGSRRRVDSVKEKRKKKRQRKLAARRLRRAAGNDAEVRIDRTSRAQQPPAAREGFLQLVYEDEESMGHEIHQHLFHDGSKVESIRIYARLHPSGWLVVEDRSIRRREEFRCNDCDHDDVDEDLSTNKRYRQQRDQQRQRQRQLHHLGAQPLPPRIRFLHFYIDPCTSCSPWMREGATSFHFRLNDILFLGASSLYNQPFDIGTENNNNNSINRNNNISNGASTSSIVERAHLLFGIDEGTGGEFVDGFEWVNSIESRIASE